MLFPLFISTKHKNSISPSASIFVIVSYSLSFLLHTLSLSHTHVQVMGGTVLSSVTHYPPHPALSVSCLLFHRSPWQENGGNLRAVLTKLNFFPPRHLGRKTSLERRILLR